MGKNRKKAGRKRTLTREGFEDQTLHRRGVSGIQEWQNLCCPDTVSAAKFKIKNILGSERSSDFNWHIWYMLTFYPI